MFGPVKIAPSILSADFMNMERDVALIEEGGAGFVHVDVMDGHFRAEPYHRRARSLLG